MDTSIAKLAKYRQIMGIGVAALILTVIFVPFQTASAYEVTLTLPNADTDAVPTSAVGSTFEVTIEVEAGELISVEEIELILDDGESSVKRAIFDDEGKRTSGASTLTRGNLQISTSGASTSGYGYGFGLVSDGSSFSSPYSYAFASNTFSYSYAFISGNSIGYSNALGDFVTGIVGPGEITIKGKLNTALMDPGTHTLDVLINTGTNENPDTLVAPQLAFTTVGNSAIKTASVPTGDDVEVKPDVGISEFAGKFKIKLPKVAGGGTLVVQPGTPDEIEDIVGDIFTSVTGSGRGIFSSGTSTVTTIGSIFEIDISSVDLDSDDPIEVTVPYDEDDIPSGVDEEDLKLFHWTGTEWDDITISVDTTENTITGEVDSFSPVAIGSVSSSSGGGSGSGSGGSGGGSTVIVNQTFPPDYFLTRPLAKVPISETGFTNAAGNSIVGGLVGQQVTISASFRNFQETPQPYAIIIQIVDENGFTTDIGWTQGTLERGQGTDASRSWTVEERGNYSINIFVWDSVSGAPIPLSEAASRNFSVN